MVRLPDSDTLALLREETFESSLFVIYRDYVLRVGQPKKLIFLNSLRKINVV